MPPAEAIGTSVSALRAELGLRGRSQPLSEYMDDTWRPPGEE